LEVEFLPPLDPPLVAGPAAPGARVPAEASGPAPGPSALHPAASAEAPAMAGPPAGSARGVEPRQDAEGLARAAPGPDAEARTTSPPRAPPDHLAERREVAAAKPTLPQGSVVPPTGGDSRPASPVAAGPRPAAAPASSGRTDLPRSVADPVTIQALLRRGRALLALGDISAARRFFERAAASGSAEAARAAGSTYDAAVLALLPTAGIAPDPAAAAAWYHLADRLDAMAAASAGADAAGRASARDGSSGGGSLPVPP
jgi:hypothetical protein